VPCRQREDPARGLERGAVPRPRGLPRSPRGPGPLAAPRSERCKKCSTKSRNRKFESISLQRGVHKLSVPSRVRPRSRADCSLGFVASSLFGVGTAVLRAVACDQVLVRAATARSIRAVLVSPRPRGGAIPEFDLCRVPCSGLTLCHHGPLGLSRSIKPCFGAAAQGDWERTPDALGR